MRIQNLALIAAAAPSALAFLQITSPSAGESIEGGKPISIAWKDSGDDPPMSELDSYSLYLHAGGNIPGTFVSEYHGIPFESIRDSADLPSKYQQQIGGPIAFNAEFPIGNSVNGSVPLDAGASIDNAYFLQMISTSIDGGTITTYSPRFSLTGMTGTFALAIERAARHNQGTHSLETQNNIVPRAAQGAVPVAPAAPAGAAGIAASYAVPYQSQDGLTKYAPMQGHPGTKITAVSASLRYPTSSYSVYKTIAQPPRQTTTQTMSNTFSVESHENSATPAPQPQDAMQKYLARWRD